LKVEDLVFRYTESERNILNNISLEIREGTINILAGPSGCGKTTLARALVGLIPHFYKGEYSGRVYVSGYEVSSTPISKLSTVIGYVFQNPDNQIVMSTVERDIAFSMEFRGMDQEEMKKRVYDVMKRLKITHLADRRVETLSGGEKQLVALAGALVVNPKIIILDEPSAYLSPSSLKRFIDLITRLNREHNTTFIIIDHRLDMFAELADIVFIMYEGSIVYSGEPAEVFREMIGRKYGVNIPTPVKVYEKMISRGVVWKRVPINYKQLAELIMGGKT
jgi:energy-coupling factor transporter ATP-binding protein EcfA2